MPEIAAIYCRISADAQREGLGVQRQEQDCRARAEREGWTVGHVYTDNDIGAAGKAKARPQYNAMLEAARAGEYDVLLAYSNSRLTRRPAEYIELITLANEGRIRIATITGGMHDLTTADGRAVALTVAAWDAAEAERTGERVARAAQQRAERGLPKRGRYRTFGYTDDYSEIVESEAVEIRDAYRRVALGESLQSIAKDWHDRGVSMGNGKPVYHSTVKNIVTRHMYAGIATYKGQVVGKSAVEPIVTEAEFDAAQSALTGTAAGHNARRYLLAGLIRCGACLSPLGGSPGTKRKDGSQDPRYVCKSVNNGCGLVSITGYKVDAMALALVRQRMVVGGNPVTAPTVDYDGQIAALQAEIDATNAARAAGELDLRDAIAQVNGLRERLKPLQALQATQVREAAAYDAFEGWDQFKDAPLSQRMAVLRTVVESIVVERAVDRKWRPGRVVFNLAGGNVMHGNSLEAESQRLYGLARSLTSAERP